MVRVWLLRLAIVALVGISAGAQQSPTQYATVAVADCGRVGALLEKGAGTGSSGSVTTRYARASFDLVCDAGPVGQLDIQTADNEPAIVSYRVEKGAADAVSTRGADVAALVEGAIRGACACGGR